MDPQQHRGHGAAWPVPEPERQPRHLQAGDHQVGQEPELELAQAQGADPAGEGRSSKLPGAVVLAGLAR